jgi:hypothetical protein
MPFVETATLCRLQLQGKQMLETVAILLLLLWAVGMVSSYTIGGFIHILLVIAVIVVLLRVIRGRGGP